MAQKEDQTLKEKYQKEITSFFDQRLKDDTITFSTTIRMKWKETDDMKQAVWQLWKESNEAFKEEKLPALSPLSDQSASSWKLPQELEPHATLNFYWGWKKTAESTNTEQRLPLFLYLHGSGPKAQEWATGLKICSRFDDAPSIYFIPQIPNEGAYYRWYQRPKHYA